MSTFQACCSAPKMEVLTSAPNDGSIEIHCLVLHIERHMSMLQACCSAPKMEPPIMEALRYIVLFYT